MNRMDEAQRLEDQAVAFCQADEFGNHDWEHHPAEPDVGAVAFSQCRRCDVGVS